MEKIVEQDKSQNSKDLNPKKYILDESIKNKQLPICIVSFPRSGNTMIRTIYENITQTYTGDDMIIKYDNDGDINLGSYGLGKNNSINNVFLIKTHYPNFSFPLNEFKCQGAILIVRNPFDVFDSYFEMAMTDTHHLKLSEEERNREEVQLNFTKFMKWVIPQYKFFCEFWMNQLDKIPIKVFKYEEFANNKESKTQEMFEFLFKFQADKLYYGDLCKDDIMEKIKNSEVTHSISYKPKNNANHYQSLEKKRFNQKMLDEIIDVNYDVLSFFGYIKEFKRLSYEDLKSAVNKKEKSIELIKQNGVNNETIPSSYLNKEFNVGNYDFDNKKFIKINDKEESIINNYSSIFNYSKFKPVV